MFGTQKGSDVAGCDFIRANAATRSPVSSVPSWISARPGGQSWKEMQAPPGSPGLWRSPLAAVANGGALPTGTLVVPELGDGPPELAIFCRVMVQGLDRAGGLRSGPAGLKVTVADFTSDLNC